MPTPFTGVNVTVGAVVYPVPPAVTVTPPTPVGVRVAVAVAVMPPANCGAESVRVGADV